MAVSISLSITQNSQNITNNTSNVTVKCTAKWTGGSFNVVVDASGTPQAGGWVKINGTTYNFNSTFNDNRTTSGSKVIFSRTLNIAHNSDGTKTLSCSASYATGVSSGTVTASASKTLTTIARKSTLTVSNGTLGTSMILKITRQNSTYKHKLKYTCGETSAYILGSSSSYSTDLTKSWTPSLTLARQNTTGTSLTIKYTLYTYTSGGTLLGSNSYSKTLTIPATVIPQCAITVSDATDNYTKYGAYVQGQSKIAGYISAVGIYNSYITGYSGNVYQAIDDDNYSYQSGYSTQEFTTNAIPVSGNVTVAALVVDSRNRVSDIASQTISVLEYSKPAVTALTVHRCNTDGTSNDKGGYCKVEFSGKVTPLNDKNTANYILEYKKSTDENYTSVTLTDYANSYNVNDATYIFEADTGSSYDIRLTISDNFDNDKKITSVSTGFTLMHWLASGLGMAIGKIAELANVLDIGFQTRFMGGILHPVLPPETDIDEVRTPNTYVGENVTTQNYKNCPISSGTFTLEVVGMGDSGQVKQRITSCKKKDARAFERIYHMNTDGNGYSWGDWICVSDYAGTLLWQYAESPYGLYMNASHTIELSEPISKQKTGVVLAFSEYVDGVSKNQSLQLKFVPKKMVALHGSSANGNGYCFDLYTSNLSYFGTKYLYFTDTQITGHSNNTEVIDGACGIKATNNRFVLRYVIGI